MQTKEKKLLYIFIIMVTLTFLVKGVPWLVDTYQSGKEEVEKLKKERRYFNRLIELTEKWEVQFKGQKVAEKGLLSETYQAGSRELVAAKMQSDLNNIANRYAVSVQSMNLPEFFNNEDILLIIQQMQFRSAESSMAGMLKSIQENIPRLVILDFDVSMYGRAQLNGKITLVGFYKIQEDSPETMFQEEIE